MRSIDEIEQHIIRRMDERRQAVGLSQQQIADAIGVSRSQVRNYTIKHDTIRGALLWDLARSLRVSVDYFFEGLGTSHVRPVSYKEEQFLELAANFARLPSDEAMQAIVLLARALSAPPK